MNTFEKAKITASIFWYYIFKIRINDFQFQNPAYGWEKIEKKEKRKKTQAIEKRYAFHTNANRVSNTGVSLWILRNFSRRLLWRKSVNGCLWIIFSFIYLKTEKKVFLWMLETSQHSRESISTGVSFLMNILADLQLSLPLFKNRFRCWCFRDSFLQFSTTTFLALN